MFIRTTSVRAERQDESGDTEAGGDSARGETLLPKETDQGRPGAGWAARHKRREEEDEEAEEEGEVAEVEEEREPD